MTRAPARRKERLIKSTLLFQQAWKMDPLRSVGIRRAKFLAVVDNVRARKPFRMLFRASFRSQGAAPITP
jgi:hypothetical protein